MNADDIPIANQERLNQEDCSKQENKGDLYSQNGNHGIGHMDGGVIKDKAKIVGKIEENNSKQSQKIVNEINIHNSPPNKSNFPNKSNDLESNKKTIKLFIKEGETEASIEAPHSVENLKMCLDFLKQRFDNSLKVKDIEKGSIKFIIQGSEEGIKNIAESFSSGKLAPLLKQKFNLELKNAQLIEYDSSENYQINQNKKLLAFTIAGNVSQADIDILKAALIDTSDNDNEEKSRLVEVVEEIRTQGAKDRNLSSADLSGVIIRDKAKVAGKIEENNSSQNTNIQVNVNLDPQTESKYFQKPLNKSQNKKALFEIKELEILAEKSGLQVELLEQSFEGIKPYADSFVASFYENLFTANPEAKPLFANTHMAEQKKKLLASLVLVVANLRSPDVLKNSLRGLGARHVKYGAVPEHYPLVGNALLTTFEQYLGEQWTPEVKQAWVDAYGAITEIMLDGADYSQSDIALD